MEKNKFDIACELCGNTRTVSFQNKDYTGCACGMIKEKCLLNKRIRSLKLNDSN